MNNRYGGGGAHREKETIPLADDFSNLGYSYLFCGFWKR